MDAQTDKRINGLMNGQTERHMDGQTERQTGRHIGKQIYRHTGFLAVRQTKGRITQTEGGQTGLDRLDNKQMDRQIRGRFISETNCSELHNVAVSN